VKSAKELERAQIGLLDHIRRVDAVLCQPARQVVGRVEMRQDSLLKKVRSLEISRQSLIPNGYCHLPLMRPIWSLLYSPVLPHCNELAFAGILVPFLCHEDSAPNSLAGKHQRP
jgi:hypothetical protein